MNFLGVGPAELIVILVVALIFVGPERLPRLAADIARTIRELRKYTSSIAAEFTEVIEDIERETKDDRSQWKEIGEGLRFDRAYVTCPQCVPSRASIMTGRSAVAVQMTRFSAPLAAEYKLFPELLRSAGYYSGVAGRTYHLDGPGTGRVPPEMRRVFRPPVDHVGAVLPEVDRLLHVRDAHLGEDPSCRRGQAGSHNALPAPRCLLVAADLPAEPRDRRQADPFLLCVRTRLSCRNGLRHATCRRAATREQAGEGQDESPQKTHPQGIACQS